MPCVPVIRRKGLSSTPLGCLFPQAQEGEPAAGAEEEEEKETRSLLKWAEVWLVRNARQEPSHLFLLLPRRKWPSQRPRACSSRGRVLVLPLVPYFPCRSKPGMSR